MNKPVKKSNQIDLALSVLCITANQGDTLNTYEIAEVCECSPTYISQIARNALRKLSRSRLIDFK